MSKMIEGTGVALVTPFLKDGQIDFGGLTNLVEHCIKGGVEYLVVMGTTGESATLNKAEKEAVLQHVIKINNGRLPIVLGVGGNNTAEVVSAFKTTDFTGVWGILSVSPYYNKPTQEGIYQHYKALAAATDLPIILYNVPGRTASNIAAKTTIRLATDFKNIVAVKEASGDMEQIMEIINNKPEGFEVISGDDNLTLPMLALGGKGVISVSGQGLPSIFTQMVRDGLAGKMENARIAHYKLFDFTRYLFAEGNPGGIKAALQIQGVCGDHVRLPLWKISDALRANIEKEVNRLV